MQMISLCERLNSDCQFVPFAHVPHIVAKIPFRQDHAAKSRFRCKACFPNPHHPPEQLKKNYATSAGNDIATADLRRKHQTFRQ